MSESIRKIGIPTATIGVAIMMLAPVLLQGAFAVAPVSQTRSGGLHFVGQPDLTVSKTDGTATVTVEGEVAGAGTGGEAILTTNVVATVGCINRGGNEPTGLQESEETLTASEPFTTDHGRGTFSVSGSVSIEDFEDFECPPGQAAETLVSVVFEDPTLTIEAQTGTITATFATIDP